MSERFDIDETPLSGLMLIRRKQRRDERGYLERIYDAHDFREQIGQRTIVQINRTLTQERGTVRGMHFQLSPYAELKLVSCLRGSVFDVAVDVRQGSPTFLHWYAATLSAENGLALLIPEGFAHGFQTLVENCEMLYVHTETYEPSHERGLHPEDPRIGINWPQPVTGLSPRDLAHPKLTDAFDGVKA
ncbi:dTDP-4-dehydrorhamnose 3,5-epimerase [Dyella lipolytica]|uniref:dTDP-4-dehydrorhamnose 3,5-epimerase n=1 Tax=Dyella lipolytica TaxID=1867835 RepID=A0ABW8IQR5_9GAMM|nr:dTDP-4-dehydrorhamnose 3,5-epimerase [Dyella lipolytica]GLQ47113.1 dTDP-4-dehydrorhamnose 3,5-epimerase [Dyella lipolytica]